MAEMPFLPLAPAVVAAVHDATGVWFHDFPLVPERVCVGWERSEETVVDWRVHNVLQSDYLGGEIIDEMTGYDPCPHPNGY